MYCRNCGTEIGDADAFCPHCGAAQEAPPQEPQGEPAGAQYREQSQFHDQNQYQYQYRGEGAYPAAEDSGSAGWGVLGFFFPIVGLILFLVWKGTKPRCAKKAGIGALIGVIVEFVLGIILGILMVQLAGEYLNEYYYGAVQIVSALRFM